MGALIAILPQLLEVLAQLGQSAFPGVDPNKAASAVSVLFDAEHTKWVQAALKKLGTDVVVDGVYGEGTKAAVRKFQETHGLVVDGWSGPATNDALRKALLGA